LSFDEEEKDENNLSFDCNPDFGFLHLTNSNLKNVPSEAHSSEGVSSAEASRRENLKSENAKQAEERGPILDLNVEEINPLMNYRLHKILQRFL
jgi:hypothetical protein